MKGRSSAGRSRVLWQGQLTAPHARERHRELSAALAGSRGVEIAFGEVTAADLTHLQLLLAARRKATDAGVDLRIAGEIPGPLLDAAAAAGVPAECLAGGPGRERNLSEV